MPQVTIGLMGLGRIGRNLLRILYDRDDVVVGAISDIADHQGLEYLLRYDSIFGRFPGAVSLRDGNLYVAGRRIRMLSHEHPGEVPWGDLGVDIVVEASARQRSRAEVERHLASGASRVVLCNPMHDAPDITVVPGVNDDLLTAEHRIVSNASCTAHAAAPVLSVLERAFGIERAFFTVVHAYSNVLRLADVPAEDMRSGRAAAENVIPQDTRAAEMLEELLPALAGKLTGSALNVPVANGSAVDLVCWHREPVDTTAVNEVVRTAIDSHWRGILAFEEGPIVSADILSSSCSGTFDSLATMAVGTRISKTLTWFDNSWGYAHRAIELIQRLARLERRAA